jgi:general secretion pathway protein C
MPRIVFLVLQVTLLAGVVLMSAAIIRKQTSTGSVPPERPPASNQIPPKPTRPEPPKPLAHYQVIAKRDLFRTPANKASAKPEIDIEALKPTDLKLKLWGTITGLDGMTRAVIEDQTKRKQALYRAGQEVSSARVKMILREKVILSVKGEDQILQIEKPASTGRPASPRASVPRNVGRPGRQPPAVSQRSPASRTVRLKLSRLGTISEDPEDWNGYAATAPYRDGSGETGLMLNQIKPSSPFRRLGIRNGDIMLSINDAPVENLGDIMQPLTTIAAGETLSLKIKRRGRERKLDFRFE